MGKTHALSALFACGMLLLTGCSESKEATTETTQSASEEITPAAQPDSQAIQKVDQLFSTTVTMQNAEEEAIKQCMKTKGFDYTPVTSNESAYSVRNLILIKPLTLEDAREKGYDTDSLNNEASAANLTAEEQVAYAGSPDAKGISAEGVGCRCLSEALRKC